MKVLIGCEFSGRIRQAFRDLGHDAWSCDLLEAEDNSPFHIKGDVLEVLDNGWDLAIFHPPCQYLSGSGMHWTKRGLRDPQLTEDAMEFVWKLMNADIPRIAIENPVSIISTRIRKPDQIIQPWQFGEDASKTTCLWFKNLPKLESTKIIPPRLVCCGETLENDGKNGCPICFGKNKPKKRWANQTNSGQNKLGPSVDRWKVRSTTYQGIADAIATQWGAL